MIRPGTAPAHAVANQIITWSSCAGKPVTPDPAAILQAYIGLTGYDPQTGANDTGCARRPCSICGKPRGSPATRPRPGAAIDPKNTDHLRIGCWYFGGAYLGLNITAEAEQQFDQGQPWQRGWFNRVVGAHAVPMLGYDANYIYVGTWARVQPMAWDYWYWYGDEAYAVVDESFVRSTGTSPVGLDVDQMIADQSAVAG